MYKLLKEASLLTLVALLLSACGGSLNEGNTDVADRWPCHHRANGSWSGVMNSKEQSLTLLTGNIQLGDGKALWS